MFLIDTVTRSGLRRRQRDPMVVAWFERQRTNVLFLSVGEIECGIAQRRTTDPSFASALAEWLDRVLALYGDRVRCDVGEP
jgi:predicted nucleic acid-binding protein